MNVIATCGAALVAVVLSPALYAHPWQALYGDELLFDVYRDGERVGQYRTQFHGDGEQWRVEASGDLTQTEVWYDPEGRWVGLQFVDQHGADMEFRCRRCAVEASR